MSGASILQVAVPSPLHRLFDYLAPPNTPEVRPGTRVRIPFGRREQVGVVLATSASSEVPRQRLRPALGLLDAEPVLPPELLEFALWSSRYYHHPVGEALATVLPTLLRQGEAAAPQTQTRWLITAAGRIALGDGSLARAPRQAELLKRLDDAAAGLTDDTLRGEWRAPLKVLAEKGYLQAERSADYGMVVGIATAALTLNEEQQNACAAIGACAGFGAFLLDGVTGSGKTEVYLAAIEQVLAQNRQALVLVPEIGLTPQLVERFTRRFNVPMAVMHSGLSDRERLNAWLAARSGEAAVVIGTRSAIFTPLARPGLIIVDEEHDLSFKQQDGFRYCARDLAVVRAKRLDIPVILGSATPSLESLYNARAGRYQSLKLTLRAAGAVMPRFRILDIRSKTLSGGLSEGLIESMHQHLRNQGQVLLFLNRRGYAPTLLCHECAWVASCTRCDARLTLHQRAQRLRCHHCGYDGRIPSHCPDCRSVDLRPVGQGTERVETALAERFPDHTVLRIDRDSTRRKGAMAKLLQAARDGDGRILLGTQMLAKGHHLPDVTLVGILDADQGLFGSDFRASERLAQLIVQVAGRAGRAERPGEVIIQTHHPEHPLLHVLLERGYGEFALETLREREVVRLPPFTTLAILRAEAVNAAAPLAFLEAAREAAEVLRIDGIELLGPVPAPMERRAGRYRAQLLLQTSVRSRLHRLLERWVAQLNTLPSARKVRYSLDVDPYEML